MSQFKVLKLLRSRYPLTTASAHNLVLRATELQQVRFHNDWFELNSFDRAQIAFENALSETLYWAAFEAREGSVEGLSKFTENFLSQFLLACPSWNDVVIEIKSYLQNTGTNSVSMLVDAIEKVQSDQPHLVGQGAPKAVVRF